VYWGPGRSLRGGGDGEIFARGWGLILRNSHPDVVARLDFAVRDCAPPSRNAAMDGRLEEEGVRREYPNPHRDRLLAKLLCT
jgi:hypothetical protein